MKFGLQKKIAILFVLLALAASSGFFFARPVRAEDSSDSSDITQELTLSPFLFDEQIAKGQSATESIVLTNQSSSAIQLSVRTSDFIPGQDGGNPVFDPNDADNNPKYSLSTWLSIGKIPASIPAGGDVSVPVTISVPVDAEDGSHYGGVLFTYSVPESDSLVSVTKEAATLFFVQTGTVHPALDITSFASKKIITGSSVSFETVLSNTGTIHLQPKGYIHISNIFGTLVAVPQTNADAQRVLPATTRAFSASWNAGFRFGPYHVDEVVYFGAPGQQVFEANAAETLWFVPIVPLILIVIALILLFVIGKIGLKKYKQRVLRQAGIQDPE